MPGHLFQRNADTVLPALENTFFGIRIGLLYFIQVHMTEESKPSTVLALTPLHGESHTTCAF